MDDGARWVDRARAGDPDAWRELYARHAPAVRRLVSGFGQLSSADLEDLVQETFIKAMSSLAQLHDGERLRAWLLSIARSRALNRVRDLGTARRAERAYAQDPAVGALAPRLDEGSLDRARRTAVVRELIAALPPGPEAETVRLFYVEGTLSASQIAERLGVGKSTVTMRLERFRARVKVRLAALLLDVGEEPA